MNTSLEPALTVLEDLAKYSEFVRTVILRHHLERIPDAGLRTEFVNALADQAATDDPPFLPRLLASEPEREDSPIILRLSVKQTRFNMRFREHSITPDSVIRPNHPAT